MNRWAAGDALQAIGGLIAGSSVPDYALTVVDDPVSLCMVEAVGLFRALGPR